MAKVFKWLILAAKIYLPYELKLFFYMYLLTLDNFLLIFWDYVINPKRRVPEIKVPETLSSRKY